MADRYLVATDSETLPFAQGNMAPPPVSWAFCTGSSNVLLEPDQGHEYFRDLMLDGDAVIAGHNIPYDNAVLAAARPDLLPLIFSTYDAARFVDTKIGWKLHDLADGELGYRHFSYSLKELSKTELGVDLDKDSGWQAGFSALAGTPMASWPQGAKDYALGDTAATWHLRRVLLAKRCRLPPTANPARGVIVNEDEQVRADFALHLASVWGFRTDPARILEIKRVCTGHMMHALQGLAGTPLLKDGGISTKALQQAVKEAFQARGVEAPRTEASASFPEGQVKTDATTLKEAGDPRCDLAAEYFEARMAVSNYLPGLERGTEIPINTKFNSLLKTGRTSASDPPIQTYPRKGPLRSCVVPRKGFLLCSADYATIELVTLAQDLFELFGETELVKALRAKKDLHVDMAALMLGLDYLQALEWYEHKGTPEQYKLIKDKRQFAKPANFGIPGLMGPEGLQAYALGMGVKMTMDQCLAVVAFYHQRWPEMQGKYFPFVQSLCGPDGYGSFIHPISGRKYGKGLASEICNARFQGRAADGAKRALYEATYRMFVDRKSWLYGSRIIFFQHDEIVAEVPEECAHEAAGELVSVMEEGMRHYVPDIPFRAVAALQRRWLKAAEPVFNRPELPDGHVDKRLIPYEEPPRKAA